jgi:hypothetical protein
MESLAKIHEAFIKDWVEKYPNVSLDLIDEVARKRVFLRPDAVVPFSLRIHYKEGIDLKAKQSELEKNGIEVGHYEQTESKVEGQKPFLCQIFTKEITIDYALLEKLSEDKDVKYIGKAGGRHGEGRTH